MDDRNNFNPFPLILILLLLNLIFFSSTRANAYTPSWICSDEEIKNYEEMGLNQDNIMYIKSDDVIYSIHTYYDNDINYDSNKQIISTDTQYISVRTFENGRWYVHEYSGKLELTSFKNVCVLDINNAVIVDGKEVSSIPKEQIKQQKIDACINSENKFMSVLCTVLVFADETFPVLISIPIFLLLIGISISYVVFDLFRKMKKGANCR